MKTWPNRKQNMESCEQNTSSLISHTSYLKCKTTARFTLVELLIVVAIIAILASLLLPALRSALNKGKAITCLSGMKQLGLASQNYLDQYNDTIFVMTSDWEHIYYDGSSQNYMDLSQIARDATGLKNSVCKKDAGWGRIWVPQKNICSVIAPDMPRGRTPSTAWYNAVSLCSISEANCSGHLYYFYFYTMVTSSNLLLTNSGNLYHKTSRLRQPSESLFWSEGAEQLKKDHPLGDLSKNNKPYGFWRHGNRTNVLFLDGHAGSVGTKQTVCTHSPPTSASVKECRPCRFWAPYKK